MSVKISARVPEEIYEKIMAYEGKDFTNKLISVVSDMDEKTSDRKGNHEVSDVDKKMSDKTDYLSKINYLQYMLNERVSLFDDNYILGDLGEFLRETTFIEKFRKDLAYGWSDNKSFQKLYDRLKKIYDEAFTNGQKNEKDLFGHVVTMQDEFRVI